MAVANMGESAPSRWAPPAEQQRWLLWLWECLCYSGNTLAVNMHQVVLKLSATNTQLEMCNHIGHRAMYDCSAGWKLGGRENPSIGLADTVKQTNCRHHDASKWGTVMEGILQAKDVRPAEQVERHDQLARWSHLTDRIEQAYSFCEVYICFMLIELEHCHRMTCAGLCACVARVGEGLRVIHWKQQGGMDTCSLCLCDPVKMHLFLMIIVPAASVK